MSSKKVWGCFLLKDKELETSEEGYQLSNKEVIVYQNLG